MRADWPAEEEASAKKPWGYGRASSEVEWYFGEAAELLSSERDAAPEQRRAALAIRRWLDGIPTFHVGALELRFRPRTWSAVLGGAFGSWTSVIVRLECASHPWDGRRTRDELELAAATRLEAALTHGNHRRELTRLMRHARDHVREAVYAYMQVRGRGPCVLPFAAKEAP